MSLARNERLPSYVFQHPAFVYRGLDEFLAYTVPFVRHGVADGEPVFVAVGPAELDALRSEVKTNGAVHLENTNEWHPVPATRLQAFHRFVTDVLQRGAEHVRLIGEPLWLNGPPGSALEWARYESVLNDVLAPFPVTLVCTYDRSRLRPEVVADAGRTHPAVWTNGTTGPSADFEQPSSLLARWTPQLTPVPSDAASMPPPFDPAAARAFVRDRAALAGVAESRSMDLALAASEILANAYDHGAGPTALRTWADGGYLVCQIDDAGAGLTDPFAGYRPPGTEQRTGRGLWLARQVVDLMQIAPGPGGTSVRFQVPIGTAHP
jgi:anti-sigma regulatory factor (Ser/Thr protein kinase)